MLKHWFIVSLIGSCLMFIAADSKAQSTISKLQKKVGLISIKMG